MDMKNPAAVTRAGIPSGILKELASRWLRAADGVGPKSQSAKSQAGILQLDALAKGEDAPADG